jgi:hypothetical protein
MPGLLPGDVAAAGVAAVYIVGVAVGVVVGVVLASPMRLGPLLALP